MDHPGVVDEDVDGAQLGLDAVGQGFPGFRIADVVDVDERLGPGRGQLPAQGLELILSYIGQHQHGPFLGQKAGRSRADAAGRAGDDDDFILDVFGHILSSSS